MHVANAHLAEGLSVLRAFNAEIVLATAQAIPHGLDRGVNFGRCPVRIAQIGHDTAQMLKAFVFVFDRRFEPVLTVQVHDHAALVKPVFAVEFRAHDEGKIALVGGHLQHGCVIVAEVVIGTLPQVGMGFGGDADGIIVYFPVQRLARPAQCVMVKLHGAFLQSSMI